MKLASLNSLRQYPILRKIMPKKHVEIPAELNDQAYNKLAEHQKAFDYLANKYNLKYKFFSIDQDSSRVRCSIMDGKCFVGSETTVRNNESFGDSAHKIYALTSEVLDIYKRQRR